MGPVIESNPSPTVNPAKTTGQSAVPSDWQTYRNDEYGFEFKYPSNWTMSFPNVPGRLFSLVPPMSEDNKYKNKYGEASIQIDIDLVSEGMSIEEYFKKALENIKPEYRDGIDSLLFDCSNLNLLNMAAQKCSYTLSYFGEKAVIFIKDHHIWQISYSTDDDIFNQILSTFRFIK